MGGAHGGPLRERDGGPVSADVRGTDDTREADHDGPPPDTGEGDSIVRNAAFTFAAQMVTSAATAAMTLYLVRALGPDGFGQLAIAVGIGTLLLLPGDFGISSSASRYIAEHRGDWGAVGALLGDAMRLKLVISSVLSVLLIALADPIASLYGTGNLTWPLRAMGVVIFAQSFMMLFTGVFVALQRVVMNLRIVATESLVEAAAVVGIVLAGGGVAGAVWGKAIGYGAAALLGVVLVRRVVGRRNIRRGEPGGTRRIFRYGSALLVVDGAYASVPPLAMLILGAFLGDRAVGLYSAPAQLITFLHYPGYALAGGIAPRLARTATREPDGRALGAGLRWVTIIQLALVVPTVVWAAPIANLLLGATYADSADVLRALAPFTFLTGFAPLVSLSVNYLGEARRRIPVAIALLVITAVLDLVLIPTVGLIGAAIATDVAYVFYVGAHLWICKRAVGLPLLPLAATVARCLVAAGAMAAVMAAFGVGKVGIPALLVGGALGLIVYVGVLVAVRAVSVEELRMAWDAVASRLRRRSDADPAT